MKQPNYTVLLPDNSFYITRNTYDQIQLALRAGASDIIIDVANTLRCGQQHRALISPNAVVAFIEHKLPTNITSQDTTA